MMGVENDKSDYGGCYDEDKRDDNGNVKNDTVLYNVVGIKFVKFNMRFMTKQNMLRYNIIRIKKRGLTNMQNAMLDDLNMYYMALQGLDLCADPHDISSNSESFSDDEGESKRTKKTKKK
ncbi:hypothetical protein ACH5RR_040756 [Cinchona calisaya]|uniref:Uncharacterized protein n=1 Tax=Cinchona calisaya TaxID=153742 RepID=A0ABD2XUV8_9GENT